MQKRNYFSFLALFIICFFLVVFNVNFYGSQFKKNHRIEVINWDVFGYYAYLPATIIYQDLAFENKAWLDQVNLKYKVTPYYYQLAGGSKGKTRIIYQQGLSYFFLPGFLLAHAISQPLGFDADGFSLPYQLAIILTSLLVTFLGLFYLRKLLLFYFDDLHVAVLLLLICIGTNWFLTVGYGHGMPHSFLFTLNIGIVYCTKKWFETNTTRYTVLTALFIGWAFSCRPTELSLLLLPLLWNTGSFSALKLKWQQQFLNKKLHYFVTTFIITVIPLFAYMQYASNDILKFNLHTEQLCLLSPYTLKFLFSFKKGWLLYTPIMFFALVGFYSLYKNNKGLFMPIFTVMILNIWIASSWENWWYAASYSQRPMVDFYGILAIPFGFLITAVYKQKLSIRLILSSLLILVFGITVFQSYQFYIGVLHNERMTEAYYFSVFGKVSVSPQQLKLLAPDRSSTTFYNDDKHLQLRKVISLSEIMKNNSKLKTMADGVVCFKISEQQNVLSIMEKEHIQITDKKYFWITGHAEVILKEKSDVNAIFILVKTDAFKNRTIKQDKFFIHEQEPLHHGRFVLNFNYITPEFFHDNDKVIVELHYTGKSQLLVSNIVCNVMIPDNDY
jgi:hypothetical protein